MKVRQFAIATASAMALLSLTNVARAQMEQVMHACKPDIERLCAGVPPGGGRIIGCLKEHKMEMSVGCAMTLKKVKEKMGQ